MLGVSEAMNMGVRCGLDPAVLAGVINVSSGRCYNSEDQNPVKGVTKTAAAAKDYQGGFEMGMCKGVVDMAVELGKEVGAKSVLSGVVQKTFGRAAESDLCKGLDCRSVYRLFSENEGKGLDGLEDLD
jgi:3-hydroxyisobutyrate dehydrogenase-like beta-hydroxyacid dehydrogenase